MLNCPCSLKGHLCQCCPHYEYFNQNYASKPEVKEPRFVEELTENEIQELQHPLPFQTYQPEIWKVQKDIIYASITAVQRGIEYAKECLTTHDNTIGRTTMKNDHWAKTMEDHIRQMETTLKRLKEQNGEAK